MHHLAEMTVTSPEGDELATQQWPQPNRDCRRRNSIAPGISDWMGRWSEIEAQIAARPRLLLALGSDRILSPETPEDVALRVGTRSLLRKFVASRRVALAFISGRSLPDIQAHIGLENVFYAGNHGMEVRGPGFASSDGLAASCRSDLVDAIAFLMKCTKRLRGVLVKDKGLTVTVHWRLSDSREGAGLRELMEVIIRHHPRLTVVSREGLWEIRPRAAWNKGNALQQILAHLHLTPADTIYVGDEFTDEDAFARLPDGLTFCVGKEVPSTARYRLHNPSEAAAFLFCALCAVHGMRLT